MRQASRLGTPTVDSSFNPSGLLRRGAGLHLLRDRNSVALDGSGAISPIILRGWLTEQSRNGLANVQPSDRPADEHPLDLARALEDREADGGAGSFRR